MIEKINKITKYILKFLDSMVGLVIRSKNRYCSGYIRHVKNSSVKERNSEKKANKIY